MWHGVFMKTDAEKQAAYEKAYKAYLAALPLEQARREFREIQAKAWVKFLAGR